MKLSIRQKLLGAFAIDLLLLMALGVFAWHQMGRMNEKAGFVALHTIPTLRNVNQINNFLAQYRALQLELLINTNDADAQRIETAMRALEAQMEHYFTLQRPFLSSADERLAFARVTSRWAHFVEANHERFIPAVRHGNTGTVQPSFSRWNPLYQELTDAAQELADLSEQRASAALRTAEETYHSSRTFILIDTTASLLISAAIGLLLAATFARRVRRLTSATIAVAGGNLRRTVEASGGDELEVLAHNFNHMVAKLRDKQAAVEERNAELRASLERQRQLTADLVRRKQAEEAAYHAQAAAEAASEAKSLFLATMSHELRTPLNAILGYAQLLYMESEARGDTTILPELGRIQAAGRHLLSVISNILDFSKIEQGKMDVDDADFDVPALVREVVAIVTPLARQNGNSLTLDCPPAAGAMRSDPAKLRQVLFNLLSNAVKFTRDGAITLAVERRRHGGDERLRFAVRDTGIGIEARHLDRLFQPFSQADAAADRRFDGTGLGLVVSRQLCHLMGGEVTVESAVGEGSTFTCDLPAAIPAAGRAGCREREPGEERLAS